MNTATSLPERVTGFNAKGLASSPATIMRASMSPIFIECFLTFLDGTYDTPSVMASRVTPSTTTSSRAVAFTVSVGVCAGEFWAKADSDSKSWRSMNTVAVKVSLVFMMAGF